MMGISITDGAFFMQSQDGEWVKLGKPVEFAETKLETEQNSVAFIIKPRVVTGSFTLRSNTRATLRRKLLGFKGHSRMKNLMKAIRLCNGDIHQKGR